MAEKSTGQEVEVLRWMIRRWLWLKCTVWLFLHARNLLYAFAVLAWTAHRQKWDTESVLYAGLLKLMDQVTERQDR